MDYLITFLVGIGIGYALRDSGRPLALRRVHRYEYKPGIALAPTVDETRWATYLASFALQCALAGITSEGAVVEAGIVSGETDYRVYASLLRRYGVWYCRGRRSRTRWLDRRPAVGVGRLRDAILRGRVQPRYPFPDPPPVFAVTDAQEIADVAEIAEIAD